MEYDDDMLAGAPAIRQQSFTADAQFPARTCLFPRRTRKATNWLRGWEKGIQQLLEQDRCGEQAALAAVSALHVHTGRAVRQS